MPAVPEKTLPVELAHTLLAPDTEQDAEALTVTVLEQVAVQPLPSVIVTLTVNVPAVLAVTVTAEPVVEPTAVPLPLTDQL